jgi:flavin reductase (DIM6/NTAB) family NADH-FMN oxidoreductase RutF
MSGLHFFNNDISQMETRYRATFINSITGFKSACLIGTTDKNGQTNLAIFSSVFHLGSNPALIGFINRPDSVDRHTLDNIMETGSYTINHIHEAIFKQAHQTAARYPKDISEFEATGLTPEYIEPIKAPFVQESPIKIGLEFAERHVLAINGTILVIGKIIYVSLPESCLQEDGFVQIEQAGSVTISGLDTYHSTQKLARLSYAKLDKLPTEI